MRSLTAQPLIALMARVRLPHTRPPVSHDAWGSDGDQEHDITAHPHQQAQTQRQQQQQQPPAHLANLRSTLAPCMRVVPSLHQLCLGVLGRHVTALVEQLSEQLSFLPPDVKAALLAVARRRGELTGAVLAALADPGWTQLDLSGCRRLFGADIVAAAARMPGVQVIDVTACDRLAAGGWRQLAAAWPGLAVIRLGGSSSSSEEALRALPHILPGLVQPQLQQQQQHQHQQQSHQQLARPPPRPGQGSSCHASDEAVAGSPAAAAAAAVEDGSGSWEDAFASDSEDGEAPAGTSQQQQQQQPSSLSTSAAAAAAVPPGASSSRLKRLRVLVWPDVPQAALELVQQRCPRVAVNPAMKRDLLTGQLSPRELDACQPLDEPLMALVGPAALEDITDGCSGSSRQQQQQQTATTSIADRFRTAYIEQAARLRERDRRQQQQQQRRELRSSHALRTMHDWLDEPA